MDKNLGDILVSVAVVAVVVCYAYAVWYGYTHGVKRGYITYNSADGRQLIAEGKSAKRFGWAMVVVGIIAIIWFLWILLSRIYNDMMLCSDINPTV